MVRLMVSFSTGQPMDFPGFQFQYGAIKVGVQTFLYWICLGRRDEQQIVRRWLGGFNPSYTGFALGGVGIISAARA